VFQEAAARFDQKTQRLVNRLARKPALLVGVSVHHYGSQGTETYNSAAQIDPSGAVVRRYDKMHPVMFGEYVPLGEWLPWVYQLTPLGGGLSRGRQAEAFEVGGLRLSPSVCFESTVPHLIRGHLVDLTRRGRKPDVLVNHTNDGWFWGSSIIDLHLTCGVFRAVEHRTPMLIAANTGLSAWIDGDGRIRAQGPRFGQAIVTAEVRPDRRTSFYTRWGDWPAAACLTFCAAVALGSVISRFPWHARRSGQAPQ
jgi:apolipoprotein N-acyltransferase